METEKNLVVKLSKSWKEVAVSIWSHAPPSSILEILHDQQQSQSEDSNAACWPSEAAQLQVHDILSQTDDYPLSVRYARSLLKALQADVEACVDDDVIVEDSLMERVVQAYSTPILDATDNEDEAYFLYTVPCIPIETETFTEDIVVDIEKGNEEVEAANTYPDADTDTLNVVPFRVQRIHNEVGLRVWEAGLFLAELCLHSPPQLFAEKNVLELGAGLGLTGILLARGLGEAHAPAKTLLTDWTDIVLDNIQHNIAVNFDEQERKHKDEQGEQGLELSTGKSSIDIQTKLLDWRAVTSVADVIPLGRADVTLVADCTYSEDIIGPLLNTITRILEHGATESSTSTTSSSSLRLLDAEMEANAGRMKKTSTVFNDIDIDVGIVEDCAELESEDNTLLQRLADQYGPLILLACTQRSEDTFAFLQNALGKMKPRCRDLTRWAHSFPSMLPIQRNRESIYFYCIHN